jgi:putative phosphoesterase
MSPLRLGIIADTHGLLRPEVFDVFAGVDRILHAGDIGSPELLSELEAIAPVTAVWGNTDGFDLRGIIPEIVEDRIEGFDFLVVHGHQLGIPNADKLHARWPAAEVIIFGHTHKPLLTTVDQVVTVMNPGGAGPRRFDLPASVGIMELEPGIPPRARLVPLTAADEE